MPTYTCEDCGERFDWHIRKRKLLCPACAMQHMADAITQMTEKKGPYYEKWKRNRQESLHALGVHKR